MWPKINASSFGLISPLQVERLPREASKKASHIAPAIELLSSLPSDLSVLTRTEKNTKKNATGDKALVRFYEAGKLCETSDKIW